MLIDRLPEYIFLGNEGESGAVNVALDVSAWKTLYPAGATTIAPRPGIDDGLWVTYTRNGETTVYPESAGALAVATVAGVTTLTWTPSDAVLDIAGQGTVVIHCTENGVEKRSAVTSTVVAAGHAAEGTAPEPLQDYIDKWGAVDATVTMLEAGADPTVTVTQDAHGTHFAFALPYSALPD